LFWDNQTIDDGYIEVQGIGCVPDTDYGFPRIGIRLLGSELFTASIPRCEFRFGTPSCIRCGSRRIPLRSRLQSLHTDNFALTCKGKKRPALLPAHTPYADESFRMMIQFKVWSSQRKGVTDSLDPERHCRFRKRIMSVVLES
jgi:hypothetical protein